MVEWRIQEGDRFITFELVLKYVRANDVHRARIARPLSKSVDVSLSDLTQDHAAFPKSIFQL
tara:strand:- start:915 stop:1100 length:186 start_codon:yes stop_codon:yes gene_type:complete